MKDERSGFARLHQPADLRRAHIGADGTAQNRGLWIGHAGEDVALRVDVSGGPGPTEPTDVEAEESRSVGGRVPRRYNRAVSTRCDALVVGVLLALPAVGFAQTEADSAWTMPRTPEGVPDLQGIWTSQTFTPLQRQERFAGQEFLTEEEAAELMRLVTEEGVDPLTGGIFSVTDQDRRERLQQTDPTHYDNSVWLRTENPKALSSRRTSMIVDPPDGRIPAMIPAAQERAAARRAARGTDGYEQRPHQERCLMWTHEGPPMMPPPYNDIYQIFQAPGVVVIFPEMNNNPPRIVATDGRPPISDKIRQWPGASRGQWEGDTLVVETTHFTDKTTFQGSSETLRVVERFTRTAAARILYEFTVEDPATWERSWSAEIPWQAEEGPLYEYHCHEGNYGIVNTLRGARRADRLAADRSIVILVPTAEDDRLQPAHDAIAFWNETLAEIGVAPRLARPLVVFGTPRPVESYVRLVAQRAGRLPVPEDLEPDVPSELRDLDADIVLLLSSQDVMSYAWALPHIEPDRHLVVIRKVRGLDRGDPMVSRHVVAHELGHTLGLRHNEDPHTLMCGPCQPLIAESDAGGFLPLTDAERAYLLNRDWTR